MPLHRTRGDRALTSHRGIAVMLVGLLVSSLSVAATPEAALAAPVLPIGFTDDVVFGGLNYPTDVAFASNGRVFVAEKAGRIKTFDSVSDTTPTLVADLRTQVYNNGDKGLLGVTVDPNYPTQPYIYALYSYDGVIGGPAPRYGQANTDGDPSYDATVNQNRTSGRLLRITLGSNAVMTSNTVLIHDWCAQFGSHSIGTVAFGQDGYLYAGGGDGASFAISNIDYGQDGNSCGDPMGNNPPATAQGGSLRAQSPRRPAGQPTVLDGTIIRIDPQNGNPAPGNPAISTGRDANQKRIIAFGLRNPYRFTFRPGTNDLWIGDVGSWKWEEINRIANPTNSVKNFGWPCYEGATAQGAPDRNGAWDSLNVNSCETLYAAGAGAVTNPFFEYRHNTALGGADTCLTGGGVVSGVTFEDGGFYPAKYHGALFLTDYARRCIWAMRTNASGIPDPAKLEVFVNDAAGPVDLEFGPDGNLYYVDINYEQGQGFGKIHRVTYNGDNQPPVIVATATPNKGQAPLTVNFDARDTYDIEGDPFRIDWDLDNNGGYEIVNDPTTTKTYQLGTHIARVRATDDHNKVSTKQFVITAGNPPVPVIDTPAAGTRWHVGEDLSFSGHATDSEDGNLAASRLSWRWIMHHCTGPNAGDCHEHLELEATGNSNPPFDAPGHEYPSFLELELTATDSDGLTATVSREFQPEAVDLTFATSPAGLELTAGADTRRAPFTRTFVVRTSVALNAPQSQWFDGVTYNFNSWSDGGASSHTIVAPSTARTYTARYTAVTQADAPNTCAGATTASAQNTWLGNTLSALNDVDWYRFNLGSGSWVRIVLGNLGRNYRLDLYRACGEPIASSIRPGKQFEEIYRQLGAGTYFVRVKRQATSVDTVIPYGLQFSALPDGVRILSSAAWAGNAGELHVVGEVLNNTSTQRRLIEVKATLFDADDNVLATHKDWAWVQVVAPRGRSQFHMTMPEPASYHHYAVEVNYSQQTTQEIVAGFSITSSSNGTDTGGIWFSGTFVNRNAFTTRWTAAMVALYDKWGGLLNLNNRSTSPSEVAPSQTASYRVPFSVHFSGWNRATTLIQGTRVP